MTDEELTQLRGVIVARVGTRNGRPHEVRRKAGKLWCDCQLFGYRGICLHVGAVMDDLRDQQRSIEERERARSVRSAAMWEISDMITPDMITPDMMNVLSMPFQMPTDFATTHTQAESVETLERLLVRLLSVERVHLSSVAATRIADAIRSSGFAVATPEPKSYDASDDVIPGARRIIL